jgi:hypothetical protein
VLFKDLTMGRNSAWQHGVIAGTGGLDEDMALYKVDITNPAAPVIRINRKARLTRQVYRFVRPGAVRLDAATSNNTFQPLAFLNADGGYVTVIRATAPGNFTVAGLPSGTYGVNYSTASEFNVHAGDQKITTGGSVAASIPAAGAITVYELAPDISVTSSSGAIQLTVRSLKPGFTGLIERKRELRDLDGWQTIGTVPATDLQFVWSSTAQEATGFFRFREF